MRQAKEKIPGFPEILFVHPASAEDGAGFFGQFWPAARAVADPEGKLYTLFGVERASLRQLFGPSVWSRLREARNRGFRGRLPIGNPWLLPGMFLVKGNRILWEHRYQHIGDQPDLAMVLTSV